MRIAFLGVGIAATVACASLLISNQGQLAAKTGWVAVLLLVLAADPRRFGPGAGHAAADEFFAVAFALLSAFLLVLFVLVLVFIQLPHERIPHANGRITRLVHIENGPEAPEVEFVGDEGRRITFVDRVAPVMYPSRVFHDGEAVSVIFVSRDRPRIDEPWIVRWSTVMLLAVLTLSTAAFALACYRERIAG